MLKLARVISRQSVSQRDVRKLTTHKIKRDYCKPEVV